jgi:hypothetical protein
MEDWEWRLTMRTENIISTSPLSLALVEEKAVRLNEAVTEETIVVAKRQDSRSLVKMP